VSAVCKWTTLTSVGDDVIKDANTRVGCAKVSWKKIADLYSSTTYRIVVLKRHRNYTFLDFTYIV